MSPESRTTKLVWERYGLPALASQGGKKLPDLIVVASEDGDAPLPFPSDDEPKMTVNAGFVRGPSELFVKALGGVSLRGREAAPAGIIRPQRFEDPPNRMLLLWSEPLEASLEGGLEVERERQGSILCRFEGADECVRHTLLLAAFFSSQRIELRILLIGEDLLDGLQRDELDPITRDGDGEEGPAGQPEAVGDALWDRDLIFSGHGSRHGDLLLSLARVYPMVRQE